MPRFTVAAVEKYCASQIGSVRDTPFGPDIIVYKARGRIFAFVGERDRIARVSLKCDPERSDILRASFEAITPGWHLNKKHWNTVVVDGSVPTPLVKELIDHSYELVTAKAPAKKRAAKKRTPRRRA